MASLAAYQEWAFSSRPGNRARQNATVPASGIWRDAARRGQKLHLAAIPQDAIPLAVFSSTWRKRMPNHSRISKSSRLSKTETLIRDNEHFATLLCRRLESRNGNGALPERLARMSDSELIEAYLRNERQG